MASVIPGPVYLGRQASGQMFMLRTNLTAGKKRCATIGLFLSLARMDSRVYASAVRTPKLLPASSSLPPSGVPESLDTVPAPVPDTQQESTKPAPDH